jgi:hypothetical protein
MRSKIRSARRTAAAAMETTLAPIAVVDRTSLATAKGVLKEFVQRRTKSAGLLGNAYRLLHLAENLRLAENHRIEPTGNPKGMANGIAFGIGVEVRLDLVAAKR